MPPSGATSARDATRACRTRAAVAAVAARIAEDAEFAAKWGDLGPVYGYQWRFWPGPNGPVDQLRDVLEGIRRNPAGRRHIVSAWNPGYIDQMALPPCHAFFK
ncbi:MAG: thymidylate synthase, partial [Schleiferiaceae bacterium]